MPSAIGHLGVKRFSGAKAKPGVASATLGYVAAIARIIGDITKDPQLMALGKGLGGKLQQTAENAPPVEPEEPGPMEEEPAVGEELPEEPPAGA